MVSILIKVIKQHVVTICYVPVPFNTVKYDIFIWLQNIELIPSPN